MGSEHRVSATDKVMAEAFLQSNRSLIKRNQELQAELATAKQEMVTLDKENFRLRAIVAEMHDADEHRRADIIANRRTLAKQAQLSAIATRASKYLQKTIDDFNNVLQSLNENFSEKNPPATPLSFARGRSSAARPTLETVEESPLHLRSLSVASPGDVLTEGATLGKSKGAEAGLRRLSRRIHPMSPNTYNRFYGKSPAEVTKNPLKVPLLDNIADESSDEESDDNKALFSDNDSPSPDEAGERSGESEEDDLESPPNRRKRPFIFRRGSARRLSPIKIFDEDTLDDGGALQDTILNEIAKSDDTLTADDSLNTDDTLKPNDALKADDTLKANDTLKTLNREPEVEVGPKVDGGARPPDVLDRTYAVVVPAVHLNETFIVNRLDAVASNKEEISKEDIHTNDVPAPKGVANERKSVEASSRTPSKHDDSDGSVVAETPAAPSPKSAPKVVDATPAAVKRSASNAGSATLSGEPKAKISATKSKHRSGKKDVDPSNRTRKPKTERKEDGTSRRGKSKPKSPCRNASSLERESSIVSTRGGHSSSASSSRSPSTTSSAYTTPIVPTDERRRPVRSSAAKIKTLKEPSRACKLRNPF